MNSYLPLGLFTCFAFVIILNGVSFYPGKMNNSKQPDVYIVNNSNSIIYFKPESRKANPGLEPDAAYAVNPGESYFGPFDAVVTASTQQGNIYRLPTGSKVVVNEDGIPEPSNLIGKLSLLLPAYGDVQPPFINFAKLANSKHVLFRTADIIAYGYNRNDRN